MGEAIYERAPRTAAVGVPAEKVSKTEQVLKKLVAEGEITQERMDNIMGDARMLEAVQRAHEIGTEKEKSSGQYTFWSNVKKGFILRRAGFKAKEARALMKARVAGEPEKIPPLGPEIRSDEILGLIKDLGSYDKNVRSKAQKDLVELGETAVIALTEALKDSNSGVRQLAADTLGRIGPEAKSAVPALIEALEAPDIFVRGHIVESLGNIGPEVKEVVPALIEALKDSDVDVRIRAANALEKIGPKAKEAVPALTEALKDPDITVRWNAAGAIIRIKGG